MSSQRRKGVRGDWSKRVVTVTLTIVLAAGAVCFVIVGSWAYDDYRIVTEFQPTTCRILAKRLLESRSGRRGSTHLVYRVELEFEFFAGDTRVHATGYDGWPTYSAGKAGKEQILGRYQEGESYPCWYDPGDPKRAVLVKPNVALYALALGPLALILAAGVLVLKALQRYFDARERRALLSAGEEEVGRGQLLAVRLVQEWLEADRAALLAFGAVLVGTLFAAPFAFWAAYWVRDHASYGLLLLLAFVAFMALRLSFRAGREALVARRSGTTTVEVSAEPLIAGESFEVWVMQEGEMQLTELAVALVCEETVVTRSKKKSKTVTRRIAQVPIASEQNVAVRPGAPFQLRARGTVPAEATPTLEEEGRTIEWKVEVRGNVPGQPDFARAFRVVVQGQAPA